MKKLLLSISLFVGLTLFGQDPTVLNTEFDVLPKSSGSDCACSGWRNTDLGDQAETSPNHDGMGNNAVKFADLESDLVYQEIEVEPNTFYTLTFAFQFSAGKQTDMNDPNPPASQLEVRILDGLGYDAGYTPTEYTSTMQTPGSGFGYTNISALDIVDNTIISITIDDPGNTDFNLETLTFNSENTTSIAIFARGIGRPASPPRDGKPYSWSNGSNDIRLDYARLTFDNELSNNDFVPKEKGISMYQNNNQLFITNKDIAIKNINIFNVSGQLIQSTKSKDIDISNFSKGIYLLQVELENNSRETFKFIK